jgi:hypothetical protein
MKDRAHCSGPFATGAGARADPPRRKPGTIDSIMAENSITRAFKSTIVRYCGMCARTNGACPAHIGGLRNLERIIYTPIRLSQQCKA